MIGGYGPAIAIIDTLGEHTYAELDRSAQAVARRLLQTWAQARGLEWSVKAKTETAPSLASFEAAILLSDPMISSGKKGQSGGHPSHQLRAE